MGIRLLVVAAAGAVALATAAMALWLGPETWSGASRVVVQPASIDFGEVATGSSAQQLVIVTNQGDTRLRFTGVSTEEPFRATRDRFLVPPGETRDIVVLYRPASPGEATGTLVLESDAFAEGAHRVPLRGAAHAPPSIEVSPFALHFGEVQIGEKAEAALRIRNTGGEELVIESLAATKPFSLAQKSLVLGPGADSTVPVYFEPQRRGGTNQHLYVRSNDPERELQVVVLRGSGTLEQPQAVIAVEPQLVDFGAVPVGASGRRAVTIRNLGSGPLDITTVLAGRPFEAPALSRHFLPGAAFELPVTFTPERAEEALGPLVIYSNDPRASALSVSLVGRGVAADVAAQDPGGSPTDPEAAQVALGPFIAGFEAEAGEASGNGGDPALEPSEPPSGSAPEVELVDGSRVYLADYGEDLLPGDSRMSYDPHTRRFSIESLRLPEVDTGLGQYFTFAEASGSAIVNSIGELDFTLRTRAIDSYGEETPVTLRVTTGTLVEVVDEGGIVELTGQPVGADGRSVIVFMAKMNQGPLSGEVVAGRLDLNGFVAP